MSSILLATLALGLAAPLSDAPRFGEVKLSTGIRMHYAEQGESRRIVQTAQRGQILAAR